MFPLGLKVLVYNITNMRTKFPDYDIMLYGTFCTPCLFGENAQSIHGHPSCVSYALSYSLLAMSANMVGAMLGNCLYPNPYMISGCSTLWTSVSIGLYAGNTRTEIRDKYNETEGTKEGDVCIHFLCSPCGVCEEAQYIRDRSSEPQHVAYAPIPEPQVMKRDSFL